MLGYGRITGPKFGLADPGAAPQHLWKRGDSDMPAEFRDMLIRLLRDEHLENNDNPEVPQDPREHRQRRAALCAAWAREEIEAEIVEQEVAHGQIVANLLAGLGAEPIGSKPIKQYAFHMRSIF